VQKTGGTSILHAAREQFGADKVLMLYGSDSRWTSPAARELAARTRGDARASYAAFADHIEANRVAFFASHMSAARLRCFTPAQAFTVVRDPVERVISQYFFFVRKRRTEDSLEEFIERPEHQNHQARALAGLDLEALGALGVLERYPEFVARLNARFNLNFALVHRKRGGLLKEVQALLIGKALRRRIAALNEEDAALYERAFALFELHGARRRSAAARLAPARAPSGVD
jgi:hypothetical protein